MAAAIRGVLDESGGTAIISALGIYGNPLTSEETVRDWSRLIDAAEQFGCRLVCGFTGRVPGSPVPESMPPLKRVFEPLLQQAEDRGVRLAFENCDSRGSWDSGDWNIAHAPAAWEMIFNELPSDSLGLEWEPCQPIGEPDRTAAATSALGSQGVPRSRQGRVGVLGRDSHTRHSRRATVRASPNARVRRYELGRCH